MTPVKAYYVRKYGDPEREAEFSVRDGKRIEVYKWNEKQTDEGVTIYATAGANNWLGDGKAGCEFFIGLTPEADDIVEAVAEVGVDGNGTNEIPSSGDSITLSCPLWTGTKAKTFMFTCGHEILPPIQANGKSIEFVQLVPLFDSELRFKKENGEAALWEKFRQNVVPYWDPTRRSAF